MPTGHMNELMMRATTMAKAARVQSGVEHRVLVQIEGIELLSSGRWYRPEQIEIRYERRDGNKWHLQSLGIHGPIVRTDGTLSKFAISEHFRNDVALPDWLRQIAKDHRPRKTSPILIPNTTKRAHPHG